MKYEDRLNIKAAGEKVRNAAFLGLLMGGEVTLGVSNDQVPHEDGDLERTGGVTGDPAALKVAVSYRDVAYRGQAVQQHEDMSLHHDDGRNAKFLERAMAATRDKVLAAVAGQVRKVTGG